jgi:hypothetical protein
MTALPGLRSTQHSVAASASMKPSSSMSSRAMGVMKFQRSVAAGMVPWTMSAHSGYGRACHCSLGVL